MTEHRRHLSENQIRRAIIQNMIDMGKWTNGAFQTHEDGNGSVWGTTSYTIPGFNRVFITKSSEKEIEKKIDQLSAFFASRNLPFTWSTTPFDEPQDLSNHLKNKGFKHIHSTACMALDLSELAEKQSPSASLTIEKVTSEEELETFLDLARESFGLGGEVAEVFRVLSEPHLSSARYASDYIALEKGKPVGTGTVIYSSGVAGIYNVTILDHKRGCGLGTVLTLQLLREIARRGYRYAILHSSPSGYNVYKRLGFKKYFDMELFIKESV